MWTSPNLEATSQLLSLQRPLKIWFTWDLGLAHVKCKVLCRSPISNAKFRGISSTSIIMEGRKHGQVHNSITLHRFKRKWFKTIYQLWILWRKKSWTFEKKHIHLQIQAIYVVEKKFKKSLHILKDGASSLKVAHNTKLSWFVKTW